MSGADHVVDPIRVLVVDDHPLVRESLRRALGAEPDLAIVGESDTLAGAGALVTTLRPDVLLLDHALPDGRGAHALEDLVAGHPEVAVVLITATPSLGVARAAVAHGAAGVVTKTRGVEPVLAAVRAAARGDLAVAPDLLRRLLGGASQVSPGQPHGDLDVDLLGDLARGSSVAEAAAARDLPLNEARRRVAVAAAELGGRSTLETVSRAVAEGLLVSSS